MTMVFSARLKGKQYLGDEFRLKCHRVYSTDAITRGVWHTDNKDHGNVNTKVKGLVFMIYLNSCLIVPHIAVSLPAEPTAVPDCPRTSRALAYSTPPLVYM